MKIQADEFGETCTEDTIYNRLLELDHKQILELGCGRAELTRRIASSGTGRRIMALEVDELQHARNREIDDLPNVVFALGGAQAIPAEDDRFDVVFMFKSLHHVPVELMGQALQEIRRVLKPGGHAYISEPVFAGEFNEILRLFHDERAVREAAFSAVRHAVEEGLFLLGQQTFFQAPMYFEDFADFEQKVIGVSHTDHRLSRALHDQVRGAFESHMTDAGARFHMPIRVDLLHK